PPTTRRFSTLRISPDSKPLYFSAPPATFSMRRNSRHSSSTSVAEAALSGYTLLQTPNTTGPGTTNSSAHTSKVTPNLNRQRWLSRTKTTPLRAIYRTAGCEPTSGITTRALQQASKYCVNWMSPHTKADKTAPDTPSPGTANSMAAECSTPAEDTPMNLTLSPRSGSIFWEGYCMRWERRALEEAVNSER